MDSLAPELTPEGLDAAALESVDRAVAGAAGRQVVESAAVAAYDRLQAQELAPISEARVPLQGCEDARIVAFRPHDGGAEHLAIIIGRPEPSSPVLTRLHSECFTGD